MMGLLSHRLKANSRIKSFRSGQGIIEYNPQYAKFLNKQQLEERLKVEVFRILLRHPYRCYHNRENAYRASNITLNENYQLKELMFKATDFWEENEYSNQNFEFYYRELEKFNFSRDAEQEPDESSSMAVSEPKEASELWQEDQFMAEKIKSILEWSHSNMQWGTMPGNFVQTLIASLRPVIDYRKILSAFRATVLSSDKMLTRFKPSRRYGFSYMGKKNQFTTGILIAVDVSASISDDDVEVFYSVINRFFKYGIKSIDVLQFDATVKEPLLTMQKAKESINVHGRGGTDFQPVIDFFEKSKKRYDGLIIFTDGYAPAPAMSQHSIRKTLWICDNKENYDEHEKWMEKCGRCCWVEEI
jgi:predicted metal-dependent peptidase